MTSVSSYVRVDCYTCLVYGELSGHDMMPSIVSKVLKKQKAILAKQEAGHDIGMCETS